MNFSQFKQQYGLRLNPQQEAAVQAVDGPVLLLAVPGSGKTTVLVSRLGYMCRVRGIPPQCILTMTYTVAAARDMEQRYAALFGSRETGQLAFRTINSVCSRIIRFYERIFSRTAFRLLEDGGEKTALLGELYRAQTGEFAPESTLKALESAITYAKNQMLTQEELDAVQVEEIDFSAFYRRYCQTMQARGLMDYDDQMVYALRILRQYPQILKAVRDRYTYFCVDEAQDTSKIQHTIIRLLAGPGGNLFMVGDEDQSIYGFRAACPQALTEFERHHPGASVLYMEENYRSTRQIVSAADAFIRKNQNRRPKQMRAARGDGQEVRACPVRDRQGQYHYLRAVAQRCTSETAVLYRDNDSALPLIDLLDRAGIPYRCRQVDSLFFGSRVVRDIGDIIRFARDQEDGGCFLNIYYKLGAGISRAMAAEAVSHARPAGESILAYIADLPAASPWTKKQCRALQTHMANLLHERGDRAVYRIVHFMGYGAYVEEHGGDLNKALILEALGAQEPTPEALLARLEVLRGVVQAGSTAADCPFLLSTIHSSKGLEYKRVFLMDVADGLLPKALPDQDPSPKALEDYEEERRLFYVAMTRAKDSLNIMTFEKEGLESSFSRELFPPQPRRQPPPDKPLRRETPDPRAAAALDQSLYPGAEFYHKTFGRGTIVSRTGDIAVAVFAKGESKKLSVATALRSGQLRPL